jgi:hypothetical protein
MSDIVTTTLSGVPALWSKRVPFDCNGTLRAVVIEKGSYQANRLTGEFWKYETSRNEDDNPFGKLPMEWGWKLVDALLDNAQVYVVYSYETPIAWVSNGEEVKPSVKYSATTSKHLGKLYKV